MNGPEFIEEWRRKSFELAGRDKMGSLLQRGFEMLSTAQSQGIGENLDYALQSMDNERALAVQYDSNREDPLRSVVYAFCEGVTRTLQSIVVPPPRAAAALPPHNSSSTITTNTQESSNYCIDQTPFDAFDVKLDFGQDQPEFHKRPESQMSVRVMPFTTSTPLAIPAIIPATESVNRPVSTVSRRETAAARNTVQLSSYVEESEDDEAAFACDQCERTFDTTHGLRLHRRMHTGVHCSVCNYLFKDQASLEDHMRRKHQNGKGGRKPQKGTKRTDFSCDQCDRVFDTAQGWRQHTLTHSNCRCGVCGRWVKNMESLAEHEFKIHGRVASRTTRSPAKQTFKSTDTATLKCDYCPRVFERPRQLARHRLVHYGQQCGICGIRMASTATFDKHMKREHGLNHRVAAVAAVAATPSAAAKQKPGSLSCGVCRKKFGNRGNLIIHERIHTGERPFACPLCPTRTACPSALKGHMRRKHGARPFQCARCKRSFSMRSQLVTHRESKNCLLVVEREQEEVEEQEENEDEEEGREGEEEEEEEEGEEEEGESEGRDKHEERVGRAEREEEKVENTEKVISRFEEYDGVEIVDDEVNMEQ